MSWWGLIIYVHLSNIDTATAIYHFSYIFKRSWYSRFAFKTNLLSWWFVASIPQTQVLKTSLFRWNLVLVLFHQMLCAGVIPEPWKTRSEVVGRNGNEKDDPYYMLQRVWNNSWNYCIKNLVLLRVLLCDWGIYHIYIYYIYTHIIYIYINWYRMFALPFKALWIWTLTWLWTVDV